ncbi:hypothetical protein HJG44_17475 [Enterovirga sp. DB1703]|uniref:Uncharacterized protein n=1 Tax=Enterovirga aerilata TaxID=2730920 RepID=A0A849IDW1_9HYPH|nr:hypothetical protein [Enterovirga sp. DB1703]
MLAQAGAVGGQACDLVTGEQDEVGLRPEPAEHGVYRGERPLVRSSRHARAGVAIDDELVTISFGYERRDRG